MEGAEQLSKVRLLLAITIIGIATAVALSGLPPTASLAASAKRSCGSHTAKTHSGRASRDRYRHHHGARCARRRHRGLGDRSLGASRVGRHRQRDTAPPTPPANLSATPGDTQVTLTWGASTDNVGVV